MRVDSSVSHTYQLGLQEVDNDCGVDIKLHKKIPEMLISQTGPGPRPTTSVYSDSGDP
jgi:hypothetical protein